MWSSTFWRDVCLPTSSATVSFFFLFYNLNFTMRAIELSSCLTFCLVNTRGTLPTPPPLPMSSSVRAYPSTWRQPIERVSPPDVNPLGGFPSWHHPIEEEAVAPRDVNLLGVSPPNDFMHAPGWGGCPVQHPPPTPSWHHHKLHLTPTLTCPAYIIWGFASLLHLVMSLWHHHFLVAIVNKFKRWTD